MTTNMNTGCWRDLQGAFGEMEDEEEESALNTRKTRLGVGKEDGGEDLERVCRF